MDIGDIHTFINFLENKEQVSWHTPLEIDGALQRAQNDIFGMYEPIYGTSEIASKALNPFVSEYQVTGGNSVGGTITMPPNFRKLLSFYISSFDNTYGTIYQDVDYVNNDEFANRMKESQLIPVDLSHPVARTSINGVIQLYPKLPNTGLITYLRNPVQPQAVYTQVGRTLSYNQPGSTQLEWNESFITKIISKALVYLGLNIEEQMIIQLMASNIAS